MSSDRGQYPNASELPGENRWLIPEWEHLLDEEDAVQKDARDIMRTVKDASIESLLRLFNHQFFL